MKLSDVQVDDGTPQGRLGWTFLYKGAALRDACVTVAAYHRRRQVFYTEEAERLEGELRKTGLTLREQQVTGGAQFSAVVDTNLGTQLTEARTRRDQHRRDAAQFEAYVGAFQSNGADRAYFLTVGDVDYFCLHRNPDPDVMP